MRIKEFLLCKAKKSDVTSRVVDPKEYVDALAHHDCFAWLFDCLIKLVNISFTRFGSQIVVCEKTPLYLVSFSITSTRFTLVFDC